VDTGLLIQHFSGRGPRQGAQYLLLPVVSSHHPRHRIRRAIDKGHREMPIRRGEATPLPSYTEGGNQYLNSSSVHYPFGQAQYPRGEPRERGNHPPAAGSQDDARVLEKRGYGDDQLTFLLDILTFYQRSLLVRDLADAWASRMGA
jgi:hypothetical protein